MDPQPSPVLMQAVIKVEQVVARLQELQRTIAGLHLSPHANRRMSCRSSRVDYTSCLSSKRLLEPDGYGKRSSSSSTLDHQAARWKNWSAQGNEVHAVISEILKASEIAKNIATLVADTLQAPDSAPDCSKLQESHTELAQKPTMRACKHGKTKDICYPSSAQLYKTMAAKAAPAKRVHKFKVAFPGESREVSRLGNMSSVTPLYKHKAHASNTVLTKQRLDLAPKGRSTTECSASLGIGAQQTGASMKLWREDIDHELMEDCNLSMEATEIKSQKPWKLITSSSKGVMFPNRVFTPSPDKHGDQVQSPVKSCKLITPLRRPKNWRIDCRLQRAQGESPEITQNLLANSGLEGGATPTCEILEPSESIVCRKRNSSSRKPDGNDGKVRTPRQLKPIDRNIKLVADSTLNTHFEVTKPVTEGQYKVSKSRLQEEKVGDGERGSSRRSMEKENKPFGCAPAGMFLRSLSRGKDRPTTRRNSGVALLNCAKGWGSSQTTKQDRGDHVR